MPFKYSGKSTLLQGLNLWGYGHSYMAGVPSVSQTNWLGKANQSLGMIITNRGTGGDRAEDTCSRILGNGQPAWLGGGGTNGGAVGLVALEAGLNDNRFSGPSVAALLGFKNALRWCICFLSGSYGGQAAGTVFTGTWSLPAGADFVGGGINLTQTQNDRFDLTVTVNSTGEVDLMLIGGPSGGANTFATVTFVLDPAGANQTLIPVGSSSSPVALTPQCALDTGATGAKGYCHYMARLTGISPGNHVIRVTKTDANGSFLEYNGYFLPDAAPPSIVVCADGALTATGFAASAPYNNGTVAGTAAYALATQQVIAEFVASGWKNVFYCDLSSAGWNPPTDINTLIDNIHPNDYGTNHLAAAFVSVVQNTPGRGGLLAGVP